ncbi:MAG: hypothetical protein EA408_12290 [Marinilabiliales bacterium]|nr:MAG: hypothetical protein EA408_12290 [Marinilabiliales bacterium]
MYICLIYKSFHKTNKNAGLYTSLIHKTIYGFPLPKVTAIFTLIIKIRRFIQRKTHLIKKITRQVCLALID